MTSDGSQRLVLTACLFLGPLFQLMGDTFWKVLFDALCPSAASGRSFHQSFAIYFVHCLRVLLSPLQLLRQLNTIRSS